MIYAIISGLLFGLFFAFVGAGLNLLFGVLKLVNLAHGDLVVVGGYLAYEVSVKLGINPMLAVPLGVIPAFVLGVGLYYGTVPRLSRAEDTETTSLVLFFGVSMIIEALATILFGNNLVSLSPLTFGPAVQLFGQSLPSYWLVAGGITIPALVIFYLYLYRSQFGTATRAVMVNSDEAATSGINVRRISAIAFGVGAVFAVASGPLALFMLGGISPGTGIDLTLTAFTVIVIGSLGNPVGTVIGGLLYGLVLSFVQTYLSSWAAAVPYVLMLAVLLIKPSGILGKRVRNA